MLFLYRVIKFSLQDITRNIWLTIVTITILLLSLLSLNTLLTVRLISANAITAVKEKIDISLYLNPEAPETQITALRNQIAADPKVKSVLYVSKEAALASFRNQYENNAAILNALKELGRNPLSPSLTITPANFEESGQLISQLQVLTAR